MFANRFAKSAARAFPARAFTTSAARADVARMTLIGRIGAVPEKNESKQGNMYLKYPLAVSTSKDHTSWFNIVAFDEQLIQFMDKYVTKGNLIYIEADASMHRYVNADGQPRTSMTLVQQSVNPITWAKRDNVDEAEPEEEVQA